MTKASETSEPDEDRSIPLPEDILDPEKRYTRTAVFDFVKKGSSAEDGN